MEVDKNFEIDWGEAGAEWTGLQVQSFIKGQLKNLIETLNLLEGKIKPPANATPTQSGLMSAEDKDHLDKLWEFFKALPTEGDVTYGIKNRVPEEICGAKEVICIGNQELLSAN